MERKIIKKGSIVAVPRMTYIDYPGGEWHEHFYMKEHLFLVRTTPTNNGNFTAESTKYITNININEVTRVIR